MTYNVQLANFGAPDPASRKPMIIEIIRSEAVDIVGLQELGSTHRADIEAGLQDLYDFYDGQSVRNAELTLLRKNVLAATGQGMVTLTTECGGSLGVTYLEVRSLRGVNFVLFILTCASTTQLSTPSSSSTRWQAGILVSRRS